MKTLLADPSQMKQVFLNVLMNGIQAIDKGGVIAVNVDLKQRLDDNHSRKSYHITFSDTGPGILSAELEHVFDPFFTTKKDGTGLGLSISYGIIRQHGGDIEIESRSETEYPGGKRHNGHYCTAAIIRLMNRMPMNEDNRILVVDDEKKIRTILSRILADEGCTVLTVDSGEEALEAIDGFQPSLILMDQNMPGLNGIETMAAIRGNHSAVPVIFLTAFGSIPLAVEAMRRGAYDYLTKPFDNDELLLVGQTGTRSYAPPQGSGPTAQRTP